MAVELETERLRLRHWHADDLGPYSEFCATEATARFAGGVCTLGQTWRRLAAFAGQWQLRGYGNWALEEKQSGRFVGYAGLWHPHDWPEPEIGWGLLSQFHGRGYATEAARCTLDYAFRELGWPTLVSYIVPENTPSRRVALRLGGVTDGTVELHDRSADVFRYPPKQT